MKPVTMKYGVPVVIAVAATGYYVWPVKPVWTVFEVADEPGAANVWLADGFDALDDCDDYARNMTGISTVPDGIRLVCGYDCRTLRSAPDFANCKTIGEIHDKS